eukprot:3684747-Prymnesium_polylepis.2
MEGAYTMQGTAVNSAPYYQHSSGASLYYDLDCDGNGSPPAWILGGALPDPNRHADVDNDGQCIVAAFFVTQDHMPPIGTLNWVERCAGTMGNRPITLEIAASPPPQSPPAPVYPAIIIGDLHVHSAGHRIQLGALLCAPGRILALLRSRLRRQRFSGGLDTWRLAARPEPFNRCRQRWAMRAGGVFVT